MDDATHRPLMLLTEAATTEFSELPVSDPPTSGKCKLAVRAVALTSCLWWLDWHLRHSIIKQFVHLISTQFFYWNLWSQLNAAFQCIREGAELIATHKGTQQ